ncbi:hypothetical protein WHT83_13965 [Aminobacter sp. P9b]|uniref:hypothetical protein n=1 Tax=Aminobacter TaxID=31988 RepID=UPI000D36E65B|nr:MULTISPECIES: hypothetical protein [Aminobacter]AWC24446.1 hypothetical protein CO731_03933 [Aminobacter sp. MSH1]CAI2935212.1 conserved exported protein of unknown function [Aminobacter niigataensis]
MVRMLALAVAVTFAAPATTVDAATNKFLKWSSQFDTCWMRANEKALEKGADARKAAKKADNHCKKLGRKMLKEGGSKYSLKDRRKALRKSSEY